MISTINARSSLKRATYTQHGAFDNEGELYSMNLINATASCHTTKPDPDIQTRNPSKARRKKKESQLDLSKTSRARNFSHWKTYP